MITKGKLMAIVVAWCLLTLFNYYYVNFFFLAFEWLALCGILLCLSIVHLIWLVKERKNTSLLRVEKVVVFSALFFLTFTKLPNKVIEKADWVIFLNKRTEIVEKVKKKELNANTPFNGLLCRLPFSFPLISNGGNNILINRYEDGTITVTFWIFANYFDSPSTQFIYSNNAEDIICIGKMIKSDPGENWKINNNWFRAKGDLAPL